MATEFLALVSRDSFSEVGSSQSGTETEDLRICSPGSLGG